MLVKKSGLFRIFMSIITLVLLVSLLAPSLSCGEPETVTETIITTETSTSTETSTTTETATSTETETETVEPIVLVFTSHNSGSGFWRKEVIDPYFRELERRSNGRVVVEEHWNGELVSLIDAYDFMLKGSVDMAEYFPGMLAGRFPMDDVFAFSPFDAQCYRPARAAYELGQEFPELLEAYDDAKLLWRIPGYSVGMVTVNKAIRTLEGSKGYKITPVGQWSAALMEALDWTPTSVPPEESTSSLETGVIDGTGISMYLLWEFGWGPIVKYLTKPICVDEMIVNCSMNLDSWNSLPKDVQDTIDDLSEWILDIRDEAIYKNFEEGIQKAPEEFGIEIITLSAEEQANFNAAVMPVRDDFVAHIDSLGLPGQALLDKYLELTYKYSGEEYKW
jgi:TRAP-type C4-dicarboxylate transport system substrate-binding protein